MSKSLEDLIIEFNIQSKKIAEAINLRKELKILLEIEIAKEFGVEQVLILLPFKCKISPIGHHVIDPNVSGWDVCIYCGDK